LFRALLADPEFAKHASVESQMVIESALAESLDQIDELDEAQQSIERAIERGRSVLPPNHPDRITNQMILAGIVLDRGDQKTALALLDEAVAQATASFGPDHVITGAVRVRIAQVLVETGRLDEGIAAAKDAARIFEMRQGRHSENGITARFLIADAYRTQRNLDASEKLFAEVLEDAETVYGPTPMWAQLAVSHADLLVDLERTDEARALLERAIPILDKGGSPSIAAAGKFVLAEIIQQKDLSRAVTLAKEAEAVWRGEPAWATEHGHVMAWLRMYAKQ
jgi:tetratricopeptide (TPR) repeat protein